MLIGCIVILFYFLNYSLTSNANSLPLMLVIPHTQSFSSFGLFLVHKKFPCKVPSFIRALSLFSSCVERTSILALVWKEPQFFLTLPNSTSRRNISELQDHLVSLDTCVDIWTSGMFGTTFSCVNVFLIFFLNLGCV